MGNKQKRKKRGLKKYFKQRGYNITKSRKLSISSNSEENCLNSNKEVEGDPGPGALSIQVGENIPEKNLLPVSTTQSDDSFVEQIEECSTPCDEQFGENI